MTIIKRCLSISFVLAICSSLLFAQYGGYYDQQGGTYQDPYAQPPAQDPNYGQNPYAQPQQGGNPQYGYGVQLSSIPQNAQNFIKQHFSGIEVTFIERDWEDIEVYLANGTQVDFFPNGDWKEVKCYGNMPNSILPANVMNTVKKTYPNAAIVKIEKQFTTFQVKLNNMMELYIDSNGQLLGQQWDD